jgi:hypothetical protein
MALPRQLGAALASAASRRRRFNGGGDVIAVGMWKASLVSSQRGPLVTRTAATREQAIAIAQRLLDDVAADLAWLHGERISVQIEAVK